MRPELPACPIPGHDMPHHFHRADGAPVHAPDGEHGDYLCATEDPYTSRCYSAHVPEPPRCTSTHDGRACERPDSHGWHSSDGEILWRDIPDDEWVRVPAGTVIQAEMAYRYENVSVYDWTVNGTSTVYVSRSDLDKLTPPDPAAILAAGLTKAGTDVWTAPDVRDVLEATGLTLGAEK